MATKISDGVFNMAYVFDTDNHETENDQTAYQSIFVEFKFNGNIYPNGDEKYIIEVSGMEFEDSTDFSFYLNTTFNNVKGREFDNTLLYAQIAGRFFNHNYMCDTRGNRPCLLYSTWDLSDRIDKQIWVSWGDSTQVKKLKPITSLNVVLYNTTNNKKSKVLSYVHPPNFSYNDWANEATPIFGFYIKGEEFCCRCGSWSFGTHGATNYKGKFLTFFEGYFFDNESKSGSVQIYSGTNHNTEIWTELSYYFDLGIDVPNSSNPYINAKNLLYDRTITSFDDTQETNHFVADDRILYTPSGSTFITITEKFKSETLTKEITRIHRCQKGMHPIDSTMGMVNELGIGISSYHSKILYAGNHLGSLVNIDGELIPVKTFEGFVTRYYDVDTDTYISTPDLPDGEITDKTLYLRDSEMVLTSSMPRYAYLKNRGTWIVDYCDFYVGVPGFNQSSLNTFFSPELEFRNADINNVTPHFNFTPIVIPTLVGDGSYTGYNFGSWHTYFAGRRDTIDPDLFPCKIIISPISDNLGWYPTNLSFELSFERDGVLTTATVLKSDTTKFLTTPSGLQYIVFNLKDVYDDALDVKEQIEIPQNYITEKIRVYITEVDPLYDDVAKFGKLYVEDYFRFLKPPPPN